MQTTNYKGVIAGYIIPNVFSTLIVALTKYATSDSFQSPTLIFSEFIIIPILMGIISAWFWRDLNYTSWQLTKSSIANSFIAAACSFFFLGEGSICLIIVSPLLFGFILSGALIGKAMFKRDDQNLNISIVGLLLLIFIGDSLSKHEYHNMVSDSIVIRARPENIWKNVVAFKPIKQDNKFWLFQIGMPSPMATTVTGYYKGAGRKCIFSNGYVFGEKIATYDINKDLTFDIIDQPSDPEIMGHIDIQRGQFLLKDNGDGTTTLTGNSWYKLYVFPVWYYDIWAERITRNVHFRVMEHIKELSEK